MSQTLITIFEDRKKKLNLTHEQMEDIASFRRILSDKNFRLDYDGTLQIMHYVGFLSTRNTRLQILPKVYENSSIDTEAEQREAMRVMINLLRESDFNKLFTLPEQNSSAFNCDILEVFMSLFADKVFYTYSRQMNREYTDITENCSFIKGKILFKDTLKTNQCRKDVHVVNYQSFEENNTINNVIKTVCIKLLRLTDVKQTKLKLEKSLLLLKDADEVILSKALIDSVNFTRLNGFFESVYNMVKMFFYSTTSQAFDGNDTTFSFLIPLNELYEFYLYKAINNISDSVSAKYQNIKSFVFTESGKSILTLRPDILVYKNNSLICIVDAKYKNPCDQNGEFNNLSSADVYQVFAYAKSYGISKVSLIYPEFNDIESKYKNYVLKGTDENVTLTVACIDIKSKSLSEYAEALKQVLFNSANNQ